jgi:tRNA (cytidine56-2'-O)-methyltransferase
MEIEVLRLGHRLPRDERISTHVALVARAFGARSITYSGQHDAGLEESVKKICETWGGPFKIKYNPDWRNLIKNFRGIKVHLTVYGEPLQNIIDNLRETPRDVLIILGGPKVPSEVYQLADFNISITLQPHSEVSALSIFLHEFFRGKELMKTFENAKVRVIPQPRGKKTLFLNNAPD